MERITLPTTAPSQALPHKTIGVLNPAINYQTRISIRLLIFNANNKILLIQVASGSYYKLPGGGIETPETHHEAGEREALEETGCVVTLDDEPFAMTTEWRDESCGKVQCQISYCYKARLVADTGKRALTEEEMDDGFSHEWIDLTEARKKLGCCMPESGFGKFVREREMWFLDVFLGGNHL